MSGSVAFWLQNSAQGRIALRSNCFPLPTVEAWWAVLEKEKKEKTFEILTVVFSTNYDKKILKLKTN